MRNKVEEAKPEDGMEMLALIESESSKGNIELLYTRRPDAFRSYAKEGDEIKLGVMRDTQGSIVAQAACVLRRYWINGEEHCAGYVGGVRKKAGYSGLIRWSAFSDFIQESSCDLFYCSFLNANETALQLFTKKRSFIPELLPLCEYTTYIINPAALRVPKGLAGAGIENMRFRPITAADLPAVVDFLNREGQTFQFAPVVKDLQAEFSGLPLANCYVLEEADEILAFGALWDQRDYKQYIVKGYHGPMKLFKKLSVLFEQLGYIPIPGENETLAFPTLTLFYAKDKNEAYYRLFLHRIAEVIKQNYQMFVVGMSSQDPSREIYQKLPSIHFSSRIYYVRHHADLTLDPNQPIRLECGLL